MLTYAFMCQELKKGANFRQFWKGSRLGNNYLKIFESRWGA